MRVHVREIERLSHGEPFALCVLDPEMRCVWANEHLARMSGGRTDHPGRHFLEVAPEAAEILLPLLDRAMRDDEPVQDLEIECAMPSTRDGPSKFCTNLIPLHDDGGRTNAVLVKLAEVAAHASDREARRRTASRFRATFEQAAVGISHHAPDGRWLLANERFSDMLGYSHEELLARTFEEITHPDDLAPDLARMQRTLRGEISGYELEKRYIRKDGSPLWVSLHVSLVRDAAGRPDYFISMVQDISARKAAEDALSTSEERFRKLFERSLDAMLVADRDGRFLLANAAAGELLGYEPEQLLTMRVGDLHAVGPATAEEQFEAYRRDPDRRGRFHFVRPDGEERIVEFGAAEIAPGQHLSVLHDITEREHRAAELRQSEETLRTVVESLPVGVWFTDPEGRILHGNPAGRRIWGGQALVGVEDYGEYRGWWADTGERIAAEEWALARAVQGETSLNELIDIETFDGERKRVLNSALPLRAEDGSIRGAMVVIQDVTPHHRAQQEARSNQERLVAVVNAAVDAMVITDSAGLVETVNRAAERMFGYDVDAIVGHPIGRLLGDAHAAEIADSTAEPVRELTAQRKDGGLFPAELSVVPVGHLDVYLWIIRDVSERRQVEATVREAQRMAAIGNLAAGLAHDMTNLLAPISMALVLLERIDLPEQARRPIRTIGRCTASLEELTDAVRQLVRGDPSAGPTRVDLVTWWDAARPVLRAALPTGVMLSGDVQGAGCILVNEGRLTRVVLNLLVNAGEALTEGDRSGGHIVVAATRNESDVFLRVKDDGPGIPPEVLAHIFEPFFSTGRRSLSTGLGLPMVRTFVQEMGGSVSIETELGEGTEVILRFPAA